uniref:Amino acid permease/ SLC12A domain-containing protein n=1 Tax=Trichuris muris TaxID=70415 RepID=A0A5S6QAR5_TRIMR
MDDCMNDDTSKSCRSSEKKERRKSKDGLGDECKPLNRKESDMFRKLSQRSFAHAQGLSLYEDDVSSMPTIAAYLRSFTLPGPKENEEADGRKRAGLGTLIGVYLPTVQHILGVQMFLRLFWIVGIAGIGESFAMVLLCCICTFLTSISISAIATNGVIESGGAYFMISRNLGPQFGGAVGILYYFANAFATSMYLVGGVEILLMYLAPSLPQFGDPTARRETDVFNNFRAYASGLLLIEFCIVALGVTFVQFFAPVSLACVVMSILSIYIGAFVTSDAASPEICMLGNRLLKHFPSDQGNLSSWCTKAADGPIWSAYCKRSNSSAAVECDPFFNQNTLSITAGLPGFSAALFSENFPASYMDHGEVTPGVAGVNSREITQDIATNFFMLLAIFYPSVTGIFTGANMSGDLKEPHKSIPVGTIAAQMTTSFIYLSFVLIFGGTIRGALLRDKYGESLENNMVVALLGWPSKWILLIGSFTSTFGAALQCLCSAPRLLQSIAKDDVIPFLRGFSSVTKQNEPFRALLVTTAVAECAILIGGIDYIAPIVDFFFLMCYCFVNLVCALQTLLRAPNWRPRYRFYHWSLSLLGAVMCLFIMFSTHWYYALVVCILCATIYKYIEYKGAKKEWGDGLRGFALSTAQYSLLQIEDSVHSHPKNWRPQLLILLKVDKLSEKVNTKALQFAHQLKAGRGLTIVATILEGDLADHQTQEMVEKVKLRLKHDIEDSKVRGFVQVVVAEHLAQNVSTLIQSVGIGGLRPNTIMVGWPYSWKDSVHQADQNYWNFLDAIHRAATADMCLLVPKGLLEFPDSNDRVQGTIDVWWIIHDGGLLLLLPFLLHQHKVWRQCKLRVFTVAQMHDNSVKMKQDLQNWVYQLRIDATVDVVEFADSTISAYTYERTLIMEERTRLALDLHLSSREFLLEPQLLADRHRRRLNANRDDSSPDVGDQKKSTMTTELSCHSQFKGLQSEDAETSESISLSSKPSADGAEQNDGKDDITERDVHEDANENGNNRVRFDMSSTNEVTKKHKFARLDHDKVRKMNTAMKLNDAIKEKSSDSQLVILNLPRPPKMRHGLPNYMDYLEVLTEGLERVLLVRGSGKEVITMYS